MSIGHDYLREFDEEMASTRKVLERFRTDKGQWKPHPKSFSFGHLAQLVSWMPGWISESLRQPFKDLGRPGSGYTYETRETLLEQFDANVAAARDALQTTVDAAWSENWQLRRGEQVIWSAPRAVVVRTHLNHLIHHRAQLGVYLRLNDIPVPPAYGPTADENPFQLPTR
jgi:uncharacterized damage-inducible protein DinB